MSPMESRLLTPIPLSVEYEHLAPLDWLESPAALRRVQQLRGAWESFAYLWQAEWHSREEDRAAIARLRAGILYRYTPHEVGLAVWVAVRDFAIDSPRRMDPAEWPALVTEYFDSLRPAGLIGRFTSISERIRDAVLSHTDRVPNERYWAALVAQTERSLAFGWHVLQPAGFIILNGIVLVLNLWLAGPLLLEFLPAGARTAIGAAATSSTGALLGPMLEESAVEAAKLATLPGLAVQLAQAGASLAKAVQGEGDLGDVLNFVALLPIRFLQAVVFVLSSTMTFLDFKAHADHLIDGVRYMLGQIQESEIRDADTRSDGDADILTEGETGLGLHVAGAAEALVASVESQTGLGKSQDAEFAARLLNSYLRQVENGVLYALESLDEDPGRTFAGRHSRDKPFRAEEVSKFPRFFTAVREAGDSPAVRADERGMTGTAFDRVHVLIQKQIPDIGVGNDTVEYAEARNPDYTETVVPIEADQLETLRTPDGKWKATFRQYLAGYAGHEGQAGKGLPCRFMRVMSIDFNLGQRMGRKVSAHSAKTELTALAVVSFLQDVGYVVDPRNVYIRFILKDYFHSPFVEGKLTAIRVYSRELRYVGVEGTVAAQITRAETATGRQEAAEPGKPESSRRTARPFRQQTIEQMVQFTEQFRSVVEELPFILRRRG